MDTTGTPVELKVILDGAVPAVGDRRRFAGVASAVMEGGSGLEFVAGDGISWSLELRRILGGVEVEGVLLGAVTLECYRCLEEFAFAFELKLREHVLVISEGELEDADDYADEYVVEGGVLDLEPLFRDAICLAIPMKHLCAEECRGLCQGCGANRNARTCSCEEGRVDGRLSPLAELKRRLEEGEGR